MADIISKLKDHKFTKFEVFSVTPVVSWEYAPQSHIDNPYFQELGKNPNLVIFQADNFQLWEDKSSKIALSDKSIIKRIIDDGRSVIKSNLGKVKSFLEQDKLNSKVCSEKLNEFNNLFNNLYRSYSFLTEEYIETEDVEMIEQLPKIRIEFSDFANLVWKCYDKILEFTSKNFSYTVKELERCTSEEVFNILQGKKVSKENLSARPFAIIILGNSITKLVGDEVLKIKAYLESNAPKITPLEELKGRKACKGIAKGKVIKISEMDYGKYESIFRGKEEYVLVAPMTRPEITPFMENANAIITDEGGITCHAAIVAREFNIPCIVGTGIATKILNEGDEVEVNANEGIIKVLKRAKLR